MTTTSSGGARDAKVFRRLDRAGPDRVVEGAAENSDDCSIDAAHGSPCAGTDAKCFPEGECADEDQHAGKKDTDQPQCGCHRAVRRRLCDNVTSDAIPTLRETGTTTAPPDAGDGLRQSQSPAMP